MLYNNDDNLLSVLSVKENISTNVSKNSELLFMGSGVCLFFFLAKNRKNLNKIQNLIVQLNLKVSNTIYKSEGEMEKGCPCLNPGNCLRVICSVFMVATSSASPLWYLMHSFPIPPVIVNKSGVNKSC